MKEVKKTEDIPFDTHYQVIVFDEVTEDSGWGSENNSSVLRPVVYVTHDRKEWVDFIAELEEAKKKPYSSKNHPYVAQIVEKRATVRATVEVGD